MRGRPSRPRSGSAGPESRIIRRAVAAALAAAGLGIAGLASAQPASVPNGVQVDKLALSMRSRPGGVISARTRPLDFAAGLAYELVGSGQGQAFDQVTGTHVCYDLLYFFDCASKRSGLLHDRFALDGRSVKSFLTPGPAFTAGYALLYRYRPDHTYRFLLQKRGEGIALVQTCVFAPPAPCIGAARRSLSGNRSLRVSFSTRDHTRPSGSFTIAVNRIGSPGSRSRPGPRGSSGARARTFLPGMAPQTAAQALAIIRAVVATNAKACGVRRWSIDVSGFPGRWEAVVSIVRDAGTPAATWAISETRLAPTNALAAGISAGC